ncbi:GntR family transcriptional regulator [Pseudoroseomonas wenyumeiae]|uniref:GntR family transcriptional regulator n=1 Tax=Teichococcus wenyumeiae TaxID=2478470 RepID=A0ABX9VBV0_9PROT|nr:GntR family transcriptional regulator [Pseudoroseomonas wenyumeiae]RMI15256.1 GntR family transcriptional regulator [Pseudoroseomonas wenyumeiae]
MQDPPSDPNDMTFPGAPGTDQRITDAVRASQLQLGSWLAEQLAKLFAVSRIVVPEALIRLAVRRIAGVSARRSWFVAEPSPAEARETLEARCTLECGMLAIGTPPGPAGTARLRDHLRQGQRLLTTRNGVERSFQLGNFHVHLAEVLGNRTAAEMLRDLTARTTLAAALYQPPREATASAQEHVQFLNALAVAEMQRAATVIRDHLRHVTVMLHPAGVSDPLAALCRALAPSGPGTTTRRGRQMFLTL